jgi:fluoroacetyl-CoA thioesterase
MNFDEALGAVGLASLTVRPLDTTVAQALSDLPIMATPSLANLFEGACSAALAEHLEQGETTITTDIQMAQHNSVGVAAELQAYASCTEIADSVFTFEIEVHHAKRLIASGIVKRKLVDRVSYSARVAAEALVHEAS